MRAPRVGQKHKFIQSFFLDWILEDMKPSNRHRLVDSTHNLIFVLWLRILPHKLADLCRANSFAESTGPHAASQRSKHLIIIFSYYLFPFPFIPQPVTYVDLYLCFSRAIAVMGYYNRNSHLVLIVFIYVLFSYFGCLFRYLSDSAELSRLKQGRIRDIQVILSDDPGFQIVSTLDHCPRSSVMA